MCIGSWTDVILLFFLFWTIWYYVMSCSCCCCCCCCCCWLFVVGCLLFVACCLLLVVVYLTCLHVVCLTLLIGVVVHSWNTCFFSFYLLTCLLCLASFFFNNLTFCSQDETCHLLKWKMPFSETLLVKSAHRIGKHLSLGRFFGHKCCHQMSSCLRISHLGSCMAF